MNIDHTVLYHEYWWYCPIHGGHTVPSTMVILSHARWPYCALSAFLDAFKRQKSTDSQQMLQLVSTQIEVSPIYVIKKHSSCHHGLNTWFLTQHIYKASVDNEARNSALIDADDTGLINPMNKFPTRTFSFYKISMFDNDIRKIWVFLVKFPSLLFRVIEFRRISFLMNCLCFIKYKNIIITVRYTLNAFVNIFKKPWNAAIREFLFLKSSYYSHLLCAHEWCSYCCSELENSYL